MSRACQSKCKQRLGCGSSNTLNSGFHFAGISDSGPNICSTSRLHEVKTLSTSSRLPPEIFPGVECRPGQGACGIQGFTRNGVKQQLEKLRGLASDPWWVHFRNIKLMMSADCDQIKDIVVSPCCHSCCCCSWWTSTVVVTCVSVTKTFCTAKARGHLVMFLD